MTKEFCVCGYMAIANETLSIEWPGTDNFEILEKIKGRE